MGLDSNSISKQVLIQGSSVKRNRYFSSFEEFTQEGCIIHNNVQSYRCHLETIVDRNVRSVIGC
jgi:repressor of nif and glnA expression